MAWNYVTLKSPKIKRILAYTLSLLSLFCNTFSHKTLSEGKLKSILVIKLDHMGDVLLATPVFENLRMLFPKAHISVMVGSWASSVVEGNPHIDEIILYDSTFYNRKGRQNADIIVNIKKILTLRRRHLEFIIDLRPSPGSLFLAVISFPKYRIDRPTVSIKTKLFKVLSNNKEVPLNKHEVELNLDVLRNFGLKVEKCNPLLKLSASDVGYAETLFQEHSLKEAEFIVAMCPGA